MIAPGREILAPIIRFRTYYFIIGGALIVTVLLLIRWVTGGTTGAIREVAAAARQVARGHYDTLLVSERRDEVGQLIGSFNRMVAQLEEGMRLRQALDIAMEVQQSLLPLAAPQVSGLDIAGRSLYCDETGGDYYDFLQFAEWAPGRVVVAVGDVVGHGLGAALLMTTGRALLRASMVQPGSLAQVMADANRLLCMDTAHSGNFMTLFLLLLDTHQRQSCWVRAGHDPAMVYDPLADSFTDWVGEGMAIGIDETQSFQENQRSGWGAGQIILIGTDGIWETENAGGEAFGKERVRTVIREHRGSPAEGILQAILDAIDSFRQSAPQGDDITLVVVKIEDDGP
jgi:phosphoserine phosphatase RsbU/P